MMILDAVNFAMKASVNKFIRYLFPGTNWMSVVNLTHPKAYGMEHSQYGWKMENDENVRKCVCTWFLG